MKMAPRLLIFLAFALMSLLATTTAAMTEPQECEVGEDGTCLAPGDDHADHEEATTAQEQPVVEIDEKCPDRDYVVRCAGKYLDTNKNGKLDRHELDGAINSLPWYARGVLKVLGNTNKMMQKCDVDKDDAISIDFDMQNNKETCLATCFKRRAFKKAFFPDCKA